MGVERQIYLFFPAGTVPDLERQVQFMLAHGFEYAPSDLMYVLDQYEWLIADFGRGVYRVEDIFSTAVPCHRLLQSWNLSEATWLTMGYVEIDGRYLGRLSITDRSMQHLEEHLAHMEVNLRDFFLNLAISLQSELMIATSEFGPGTKELVEIAARIDRMIDLVETPAELIFDRLANSAYLESKFGRPVVKLPTGLLYATGPYQ